MFNGALNGYISIGTEIPLILMITIILIFVQPVVAILVFSLTLISFITVQKPVMKMSNNLGNLQFHAGREVHSTIQQALHGLVDIKMGNSENYF
ncbi:MAG: hypothetical protein GTO02_06010, partial [Candidatus Dadabacteria bacterium]|nr:hypothetical protein [Candidatus Dadabacteria bacterium]